MIMGSTQELARTPAISVTSTFVSFPLTVKEIFKIICYKYIKRYKKQALLHEFLVGQPFRSVSQIDDAAILEAGLGYNVLHDMVVAVRVDPDIAA